MNKLKNIVGLAILLFPFMIIGLGILLLSGVKSHKIGFGNDGYTIGIVKGTAYEELLWSFPGVSSVTLYRNNSLMWEALQNKKIDIAVNDKLKSLAAIKNRDFDALILNGDPLRREMKTVAFKPGDETLRQAINRGIHKIIENGVYREISERYFNGNILEGIQLENPDEKEPRISDSSWENAKRQDTLIIALAPDNPPFSYLHDHKQWRGFDVDIAWAVCIQLGIKNFCPVPVDKTRMAAGLRSKLYDAVWGGIEPTAAMRQKIIFSIPYCITGPQLITRKNSKIPGPEALTRPADFGSASDLEFERLKAPLNI